jgi:nicotinamide-nucleotide amidase
MKSLILTIGDELLIGQVINTNAAYIAGKLNGVGVEVVRMITVSDAHDDILLSFSESVGKYDVVIVTGGLGPTHDDVTKKALCEFFKTYLIPSAEARKNIKAFLKSRNHPWSDAAEEQTYFPRGATLIPNSDGTASGMLFEHSNTFLIAMPGVPYEMEGMMNQFVVPFLRQKAIGKVILHRTLKTTGIPESVLASKLGNIEALLQGAKLAFLPSPHGVRMRITLIEENRNNAEQKISRIESDIRSKVEKYIYGVDEEELEGTLGKILTKHRLTLAVAESCTGGLIANRITNVPGSSNYFERGVITYSNQSKIDLLNVPPETINTHGAVSKEVAEAMACGIRLSAKANIGISTTGIAGPSGGTVEKPVGLIWIGYSDAHETLAVKFNFGTGRVHIKERAAQAALEIVRRKLLKIE